MQSVLSQLAVFAYQRVTCNIYVLVSQHLWRGKELAEGHVRQIDGRVAGCNWCASL